MRKRRFEGSHRRELIRMEKKRREGRASIVSRLEKSQTEPVDRTQHRQMLDSDENARFEQLSESLFCFCVSIPS